MICITLSCFIISTQPCSVYRFGSVITTVFLKAYRYSFNNREGSIVHPENLTGAIMTINDKRTYPIVQNKIVKASNDQEIAQLTRNSLSKIRGGEKIKFTIRYLYIYIILREHILRRVSSYFATGGHSVARTELKCEYVHKVQTTRKLITPKPQHKYRL